MVRALGSALALAWICVLGGPVFAAAPEVEGSVCDPLLWHMPAPWAASPCAGPAAQRLGLAPPMPPGGPPPPVVAAVSPAPTMPAAPVEPRGLRQRRHYFIVSPAGILVEYSRPMYMYSLEAGLHRPLRRNLALQIGAFFAHGLYPGRYTDPERNIEARALLHLFALGPQIRLGAGNERVFVYALTRLGMGIDAYQVPNVYIREVPLDGPVPYFHGSVGAGLLWLVGRRTLLGGELAGDFAAGGRLARGNLLVGVTF